MEAKYVRLCSVEGCKEKHEAKGYCKAHYRSYSKYGDPLQIEKNKQLETRPYKLKGIPKVPYEENHKMINEVEHKICRICEEFYPMDEEHFYKKKTNLTDGYDSYCKPCAIQKSSKRMKEPEVFAKWKDWVRGYWKTEKFREHSKKNNEQFKDKQKEWRQNNPDKNKVAAEKWKAKNQHEITEEEWEACLKFFDYSCAYCGISEAEAKDKYGRRLNKEHVDCDGANDISNNVPACTSCNSSKRQMELVEWYNPTRHKKFSEERLNKIFEWLLNEHKLYINKNI